MELEETTDFVQNSYILMIGYFISSLISTITTIIIIRFLSIEEYGLINIAYILPSIVTSFSELGLNYASINFIAKRMKENDKVGARNIIIINLIIKISIGLAFTFLIAFFSIFIAKNVYLINDNRLIVLIQIASIGVISTILYESINSFFIGAQKMKVVQFGAILHTTSRGIISLCLIYLGFNVFGIMIGFVLSPLIVVFFYLIFLKRTFSIEKAQKKQINWNDLKQMMKYGYPLLIFSIIAGIKSEIFTYILTVYGFLDEVSYFNVSVVSAAILGILTKSIFFSLFPIFSKLNWNNENERKILIKYFQFSVKLGTLMIVPVSIFLILFSEYVFPRVFGIQYINASPFISIYFLYFLLVPLGSLSITAFFNGQKNTIEILKMELIFLISGVIFAIILINFIGSIGLFIGFIIGNVFSIIYGNFSIRRKYGNILFKNTKSLLIITIIAFFSAFCVLYIYKKIIFLIKLSGWIMNFIFLGVFLGFFIIIFLFLIGIFSLISIEEIDFFVNSFEKFPLINKIIYILAKIEKLLVNKRLKRK